VVTSLFAPAPPNPLFPSCSFNFFPYAHAFKNDATESMLFNLLLGELSCPSLGPFFSAFLRATAAPSFTFCFFSDAAGNHGAFSENQAWKPSLFDILFVWLDRLPSLFHFFSSLSRTFFSFKASLPLSVTNNMPSLTIRLLIGNLSRYRPMPFRSQCLPNPPPPPTLRGEIVFFISTNRMLPPLTSRFRFLSSFSGLNPSPLPMTVFLPSLHCYPRPSSYLTHDFFKQLAQRVCNVFFTPVPAPFFLSSGISPFRCSFVVVVIPSLRP